MILIIRPTTVLGIKVVRQHLVRVIAIERAENDFVFFLQFSVKGRQPKKFNFLTHLAEGQVSLCHHLGSVAVVGNFSKSPLKLPDRQDANLA